MPPCHGGDRRFESGRARQLYTLLNDSPRESFFNLYHFQSVIIEIHFFCRYSSVGRATLS